MNIFRRFRAAGHSFNSFIIAPSQFGGATISVGRRCLSKSVFGDAGGGISKDRGTYLEAGKYSIEIDGDDAGLLSEVVDLETHSKMLQEYHLEALGTQRVLVVQPYFRSGEHKLTNTRAEYMLEESLALVQTLGWTVVDKTMIGINAVSERSVLFGTGQLESIRELVRKLENPDAAAVADDEAEAGEEKATATGSYVSAVFVSSFRLTPGQMVRLQDEIGKPVLDRYNIILQIFKRHATTREAKLQIDLAEIPYLKLRLDGDHELEQLNKHSASKRKGEEFFVSQRKSLNRREKKIRKEMQKFALHRSTIRRARAKNRVPTVAVVGYTNAGKTSLVKVLTGQERLKPRNQLFATLDVTVHDCRLPSALNALMVDTIGFISDIPLGLIASFNSTLEDALMADVLIHVRDMSNDDHVAQEQNVLETLKRIDVPQSLMDTMITVGNKIDRLHPEDWKYIKEEGVVPISCKEGYGIDYLFKRIDEAVIRVTGKRKMLIKVPIEGARELEWLRKNVTVSSVELNHEDDRYWTVEVLLNDIELNKFKRTFLGKTYQKLVEERKLDSEM